MLLNKQIEQIAESQAFAHEEHKQKAALLQEQFEISLLEKEEKKIKQLKLEVTSKKSILSNI